MFRLTERDERELAELAAHVTSGKPLRDLWPDVSPQGSRSRDLALMTGVLRCLCLVFPYSDYLAERFRFSPSNGRKVVERLRGRYPWFNALYRYLAVGGDSGQGLGPKTPLTLNRKPSTLGRFAAAFVTTVYQNDGYAAQRLGVSRADISKLARAFSEDMEIERCGMTLPGRKPPLEYRPYMEDALAPQSHRAPPARKVLDDEETFWTETRKSGSRQRWASRRDSGAKGTGFLRRPHSLVP